MQQIKMSTVSSKNNSVNSTTKQRGNKMTRVLSPVEKNRLVYQGNFKKKVNLEAKIVEQKRVVAKKAKLVSRRSNGEVFVTSKRLTPAEVAKERTVLEKLKTELAKAKDSLKHSRFSYKKTTLASTNKFKRERSSLVERNKQKNINKALRLVKSGNENGRQNDLKAIVAKLKGKELYSDQDFKREVLPIINTYNTSIPVTSLSKDAITKIKEMLNDIK